MIRNAARFSTRSILSYCSLQRCFHDINHLPLTHLYQESDIPLLKNRNLFAEALQYTKVVQHQHTIRKHDEYMMHKYDERVSRESAEHTEHEHANEHTEYETLTTIICDTFGRDYYERLSRILAKPW